MPRGVKLDITGWKFKTYTALEPVGRASGGSVIWRCICECGLEANHQIGNLRNGSVRCKCQNLSQKEAAVRELYSHYKREATVKRDLAFALDRDHFSKLVSGDCYYCGVAPLQVFKTKTGTFCYNGIDRVDNDKGYIEDNVVSCCGDCNRAKRTMTLQQFSEWVKRIYKHWANKT